MVSYRVFGTAVVAAVMALGGSAAPTVEEAEARDIHHGIEVVNRLSYPIYAHNVPPAKVLCPASDEESKLLQPGEKVKFAYSARECGTSIKVSKPDSPGVFAFEYTIQKFGTTEMWVNLSDIDGKGPGAVGTTFMDAKVTVTPKGGLCTKKSLVCEMGQTCHQAYQFPSDDKKIETCSRMPHGWQLIFGAN